MKNKIKQWFTSIKSDNIEVIKQLLDNNFIDINVQDKDGKTALILACDWNHVDIIKLLLSNDKIDIFINDNNNKIALDYINKDNTELLNIFKDKINLSTSIKTENWHFLILKNNIKAIKYLVNNDLVDINMVDDWNDTALIIASSNNYIDIVKFLLSEENIEIFLRNKDNMTALDYAKKYNYTEIENLLNEHLCLPENWYKCIYNNYIDAVKCMLDNNVININKNDNSNNYTNLMVAIIKNCFDIVKLFITYENLDINMQDKKGYTALIYSIINDKYNIDIIKILLEHKNIDINIQDLNGNSALYHAIVNRVNDVVLLLLQHPDININVINNIDELISKYCNKENINIFNKLKNKDEETDVDEQEIKPVTSETNNTNNIDKKHEEITEVHEENAQNIIEKEIPINKQKSINFKHLKNDIKDGIKTNLKNYNINYGDLSEIGNLIGIVIGNYITDEEGFTKEDFISGLNHGINLIK
jgi:serine/threonine-protein phosphatase 6 regulatory ankyrin repeat subunit B